MLLRRWSTPSAEIATDFIEYFTIANSSLSKKNVLPFHFVLYSEIQTFTNQEFLFY